MAGHELCSYVLPPSFLWQSFCVMMPASLPRRGVPGGSSSVFFQRTRLVSTSSHARNVAPGLFISMSTISPTRSPTRSQAAPTTHNKSASQPQYSRSAPFSRAPSAELQESAHQNNKNAALIYFMTQQNVELEPSGVLSGLAGLRQTQA